MTELKKRRSLGLNALFLSIGLTAVLALSPLVIKPAWAQTAHNQQGDDYATEAENSAAGGADGTPSSIASDDQTLGSSGNYSVFILKGGKGGNGGTGSVSGSINGGRGGVGQSVSYQDMTDQYTVTVGGTALAQVLGGDAGSGGLAGTGGTGNGGAGGNGGNALFMAGGFSVGGSLEVISGLEGQSYYTGTATPDGGTAGTAGTASVQIYGASGATGNNPGRDAIINAGTNATGTITLTARGSAAVISAIGGGGAGTGTGGQGLISSTGDIIVQSGVSSSAFVTLLAEGGYSNSGTFGTGKIHTDGKIIATSKDGSLFIAASAGNYSSQATGGNATIEAKGIELTVTGSGSSFIRAGYDVVSSDVSPGASFGVNGAALIDVATGNISLTLEEGVDPTNRYNLIRSMGLNNFNGDGGSSTIKAHNITIDTSDVETFTDNGSNPADLAYGQIIALGGNARGSAVSSGGSASIEATGDITLISGNADVYLAVNSGYSVGAQTNRPTASIEAQNIIIEAQGIGSASVDATGNWTYNHQGVRPPANVGDAGDALVSIANNLIITGASNIPDISGTEGSARISVESSSTEPDDALPSNVTLGSAKLIVGGDVIMTSGSADSGKVGGAAELTTDDIDVAGKVIATTGEGDGNIWGLWFSSKNLSASEIILTKNDGQILFKVTEELKVTDRDTALTLDGTAFGDVQIASATVQGGHRFSVFSTNAALLSLTDLNVPSGESARIAADNDAANTAKLTIGSLNASGATVVFELPASIKAGDIFLDTTSGADLSNAKISIDDSKTVLLAVNDEFVLVNAPTGLLNVTGAEYETTTDYGGTMRTYAFSNDGAALKVVLASDSANPTDQVPSEGVAGQVAFVNAGADLAVDVGTTNAAQAAAQGMAGGPAAFNAFSFGRSRYATGSYVNVKSFSLMIGASYLIEAAPTTDVTVGLFFEYGKGSYDSHNSFSGYGDVEANGDTNYAGGGLLVRIDFAKSPSGYNYVDVSARYGRVANEFSSNDFVEPIHYDFNANYLGVNAGIGHVFNFSDTVTLDIYGKYLWTRQEGKTVKISESQTAIFDPVSSQRIRLGGRASLSTYSFIKPYFGAAFEYEFGGDAKSTISGQAIEAPSLKGSTGMGELGITIDTGTVVNLDLGVQGYLGKRRGIAGSVVIDLKF
jgi:hypothetical protein